MKLITLKTLFLRCNTIIGKISNLIEIKFLLFHTMVVNSYMIKIISFKMENYLLNFDKNL